MGLVGSSSALGGSPCVMKNGDTPVVVLMALLYANSARGRSSVSQLAMGCVTCHTCHGCVTDFRPILGNIVEVTLMTSPILYIVSHAKGTSFP